MGLLEEYDVVFARQLFDVCCYVAVARELAWGCEVGRGGVDVVCCDRRGRYER